MIRGLLGQPPRVDEGMFTDCMHLLRAYKSQLSTLMQRYRHDCDAYARYEIWTRGFEIALNELEESIFSSEYFRKKVEHPYLEEMGQEEQQDYYRHIYFYKNAIIRVFSTLDKLGYFMNDVFGLHTERIKERFSYFSVLRQMRFAKKEADLLHKLNALKDQYAVPLSHLRKQRNMEIHLINAEMMDDLAKHHGCAHTKTPIEDLDLNTSTLQQTFSMICQVFITTFEYIRLHPSHHLDKRR